MQCHNMWNKAKLRKTLMTHPNKVAPFATHAVKQMSIIRKRSIKWKTIRKCHIFLGKMKDNGHFKTHSKILCTAHSSIRKTIIRRINSAEKKNHTTEKSMLSYFLFCNDVYSWMLLLFLFAFRPKEKRNCNVYPSNIKYSSVQRCKTTKKQDEHKQ